MATATDSRLTLRAETAADLMRSDVIAVPRQAPFDEVLAALIDHDATVARVVGGRGEPVGVVSRTDLLIHVRESVVTGRVVPATAERLMTPTLFSVGPDTPACEVVRDMLRSKVHHLFVADERGSVVGVISACDLVHHLH
jgi:CBS-domain-containing membrane protein